MDSNLKRLPCGLRMNPKILENTGYKILGRDESDADGLIVRLLTPVGMLDVNDPDGELTISLEEYFFNDIDDKDIIKMLKSVGVEIVENEG